MYGRTYLLLGGAVPFKYGAGLLRSDTMLSLALTLAASTRRPCMSAVAISWTRRPSASHRCGSHWPGRRRAHLPSHSAACGEPNPGVDVAGVRSPVPVQMWHGVSPVPTQMWER